MALDNSTSDLLICLPYHEQGKNMRSSFPDQYPLRMPAGMRSRIRANADANRRSMNSEIVYILDRALAAEEKNGPAEAPTSPDHGPSNSPQEKANEHVHG